MPNYCSNAIIVTGEEDIVSLFKKNVFTEGEDANAFDFSKVIPMPESLKKTQSPNKNKEQANRMIEHYGVSNWYEWANINWGTKWGTFDSRLIYEEPTTLQYEYTTAWTPLSEDAVVKMSKEYPALEFEIKYAESGIGYWGILTVKDGEIVLSEYGNLDCDYDEETEEWSFSNSDGGSLPDGIEELAKTSG